MNRFMAHRVMTRIVASLLVVCLLIVGGVASAQSLGHESQHAHHQKAAHGTLLCSWMCAAGQVLDSVRLIPEVRFNLLAFSAPAVVSFPIGLPSECPTSRGPPVFSI